MIGAGSGGVRAARMAAQYGARVAICEDRLFGGTCVNLGCIPKKYLVYASQFRDERQVAADYGWRISDTPFRFSEFQEKKSLELARLQGIYRKLLEKAGVKILEGAGRIMGPHTVMVGGFTHTAAHILIATGSRPVVPEIPGAQYGLVSDDIFSLKELPKRMVIVGGGYIAVELAGIFHHLGVEIQLLYRGPLFLRGFDLDLRTNLKNEMEKKGIGLHFNTKVTSITKDQNVEKDKGATHNSLRLHLDEDRSILADALLFATGRRARTDELGLGDIGIEEDDDGFVVVNENNQSSVASIYAVGDVVGGHQLTPVALREGMKVASHLFGNGCGVPDATNIPTAVFSQPPLATVGLTEEEARQLYPQVRVYRSQFTPLKYTLCEEKEQACVKIVVEDKTDRVVGCHMMGEAAPEIMQGLAVAMTCGATKKQFDATLGIHPTSAEEFVTMRESISHA